MKLLICLYDSTDHKTATEAFNVGKLKQVADVEGYGELMDHIESICNTLELNIPNHARIAVSSGGNDPMLIELKDLDTHTLFNTPDEFWAFMGDVGLKEYEVTFEKLEEFHVSVKATSEADAIDRVMNMSDDEAYAASIEGAVESYDNYKVVKPEPTPTNTYRVVYSSMTKHSVDVQADAPEEASRIARGIDGSEFRAWGDGDWEESEVYEVKE